MNSPISVVFLLTLVLLLASCGGGGSQTIVAGCVFPGTKNSAPLWVCDKPVPELQIQGVGIAERSQAGLAFMKDIAAANARTQIASQLQNVVEAMVKTYIGTTGVGKTETVDQIAQSISKNITNATVSGARLIESRTDINGRLYVLVGISEGEVQKQAQRAVRISMQNDTALWQEFKAKQGFEALAEEIAKVKLER